MAETLKSPVSTTDDFEPLLVSEDEERAPRAHEAQPPLRRVMVTACYCLVMVVNGGMCGAFGPSLEYFERSTGLSQAVLGGAVMQNRLAKLAGTVLWGWYASSIQQQRGRMEMLMPPHQLMAAVLLVSAACSATLGFTRSGAVLQIAMVVSGFMYGVSDSAANLLVIWVWDYDPRKLRINVRRPRCARAHARTRHSHIMPAPSAPAHLLHALASVGYRVRSIALGCARSRSIEVARLRPPMRRWRS